MKYTTVVMQSTEIVVGAAQPAAICYDCNRSTSGRCWRHTTGAVVTIVPMIVQLSHTFTPYDRTTGASPFPIMGDLVTEIGPLLR